MLAHRLVRSLVGFLTLSVIVDQQFVAYILVDRVDSFAHSLAVSHILLEAFVEVLAPVFALLVQIDISHHVVEEDVVGHLFSPRELSSCLICIIHILQQEIGSQGLGIPFGHIRNEESHAFSLCGRSLLQRLPEFFGVVASRLHSLAYQFVILFRHTGILASCTGRKA